MKSTLTNGVGCEGWMSELPDDVLLSKLSIPGTHNSMSYTCYEANIILKIISGLSKLGKDRLAELVSQIVELKKNSELSVGRRTSRGTTSYIELYSCLSV